MSEAHALHPLKSLLQLQLASDAYAAIHLPYILQSLTTDAFLPSPHLPKWTTRLSSLLSSKDAGGRWAGLSIALRTSIVSRSIMIECAQGWISVALPLLSRPEHPPISKVSIRLLEHIFTSTVDMPEFQRQLATPNVPKFSQALVALADTSKDEELRNLSFATLIRLVPIYPTLHRALYPTLSSLSLRFLNGTPDKPTSSALMDSASKLYSVLPFTGGKVGSAALWRKAVDETLSFCWDALGSITTTTVWDGPKINKRVTPDMDPISALPLNLDRLRCGIKVLEQLLHSPVARPVRIPIGSITDLIVAMLSCTSKNVVDGHIDNTIRSIEISMIPEIWHLCINLLCSLTGCTTSNLIPHVPRIVTYIVHHLEQKIPPIDRLVFLRALNALLSNNLPIHSTLLANRIAKVALNSVSILSLPGPTSSPSQMDQHASKQGKKRARGYEGDEVFSNTKTSLCSTQVDGEIILVALEVLEAIMQQAQLSSSVYSIASRTVLSHLLMLPHIPPIKISENIALHGLIVQKLHHTCVANGTGSPDGISKIFGLAIAPRTGRLENASLVDLAIHPRLPPLLKSIPHVESLALYKSEEGDEEASIRKSLGLAPISQKDTAQSNNEDVAMEDTRTRPITSNVPPPVLPVSIKEPAVSTTPASNALQVDFQKTIPPPGPAHQQSPANDRAAALVPLETSVDTLDKALPQSNLALSTTYHTLAPSLEPSSSTSNVISSVPEPPVPMFSMTVDEDEDDNEDVPIINPDSDSEDEG